MKTIALILFGAAFLAAQNQPDTKDTAHLAVQDQSGAKPQAQKPAVPAAASQGPSLPAGAVQVEPYLYRYTDAQGKTWMYRRTPFGFSRWEDVPAPQPVVEAVVPVAVTDLGDRVQFERKTPFGISKWTRKKTELTPDEKTWLDRQQSKQPDAPPVSTSDQPAGPAAEKR